MQRIPNQQQTWHFMMTLIEFWQNNFLFILARTFAYWYFKAKRGRNSSRNIFYKCVLEFHCASIPDLGGSFFSLKKVKIIFLLSMPFKCLWRCLRSLSSFSQREAVPTPPSLQREDRIGERKGWGIVAGYYERGGGGHTGG